MEKETKLTPQESLKLITEVINQTKENIKSHSFIFLLWGWTLATASILRFLIQTKTDFKYYFLPFPILVAIALIVTINYNRNKTSETHLNFFLKKLWMALAFGFIATVFVSVYQKIEPFTYTLILAAIGTTVSGMVMKFKPLMFGGVCFLIASICCVFITDEFKVLIHGFAIIVGYLIPGYILKNSKS
jgi:predicted neutral ceramidase superfamily lipid hydrolase